MNTKIIPAIVVVGYNRYDSFKRVLNSVINAVYDYEDIPLIISIDKHPENAKLVNYAENLIWSHGEKIVKTFSERQGLKNHILQCGDLALKYGAVIILEDDVIVAPDFYQYITKAFEFYDNDTRIAGISLYSHRYNGYAKQMFEPIKSEYDVYIGQINVTWGQGWTKKQWNNFRCWYENNKNMEMIPRNDMPEQIHRWKGAWSKYFAHYMIMEGKYYVLPYYGLSTCFSEQGEHTGKTSLLHQVPLNMGKNEYKFPLFEKSLKYDLFFEYIGIEKYLGEQYKEKKVCCSLYGNKNFDKSHDYILTLNQMDKEIVKSYGLKMWPMELNIIYNIPGNVIHLYNLRVDKKQKNSNSQETIWGYQMRFMNWKDALKYIFVRAMSKILKKGKKE